MVLQSKSQEQQQRELTMYNWWIKERQWVINCQYSNHNLRFEKNMAAETR